MTHPTPGEDELAALLALDALEPDEQPDAELRLGMYPPGLAEAAAVLAEATVAVPPPELRTEMLTLARSRRPPGRPIAAVDPCRPIEAFRRTVDEVDHLLSTLTDSEWVAQAHPEHGRVKDLVAHLVGVERLVLQWLDPAGSPTDDVAHDHIAATRPVVAELAETDPRAVARQWREAARAVAAAAESGGPDRPTAFHEMSLSVDDLLVTRTFELWAHAMDISVATGRPLHALDAERMALMSRLLMAMVPMALEYRHVAAHGRTARFVLTGPAGGCYTVPLHPGDDLTDPDVTIVADTVGICRVAARRLSPRELGATVEGDGELAGLVLAAIDAFARD
jgi:uncharacterized protein (TIGR03083 family)